MTQLVGTVQSIWRYPVKSILGEAIGRAAVSERGLDGDRAYALVDADSGKVISVKYPKRWGKMFDLAAVTDASGVRVRFPDGTSLSIDDPALVERLGDFFGRRVTVATVPPPDARFDEEWVRELKDGADPYFDLPSRVEDGEELIDGGQFMHSFGNFFNFGAIHIVTTSTARRLAELAPESRFDPHRFRPNIVVDTEDDGFVENDWPGKTLTIGDLQLTVSMVVPRCVMTTLAQGDLPADRDVLRTITKHNSLAQGGSTTYPCVGVYADVTSPGTLTTNAAVTVGQPTR